MKRLLAPLPWFACVLLVGTSGCGEPLPPVVSVPHEPATITPSTGPADLAFWEGLWDCTNNNFFANVYIKFQLSEDGGKLIGMMAGNEGEKVKFFPLSDIEANGERVQFSWQYSTDITVGDLGDQIADGLLDKSKDRKKNTSRLVLTSQDVATEHMLHEGKWMGFDGDPPLFKKRK